MSEGFGDKWSSKVIFCNSDEVIVFGKLAENESPLIELYAMSIEPEIVKADDSVEGFVWLGWFSISNNLGVLDLSSSDLDLCLCLFFLLDCS